MTDSGGGGGVPSPTRYSDLPPAGSIGLVKVDGLAGDAIRFGQFVDGDGFRDYEHAFVLYQLGSSPALCTVIEAETQGVVFSPLSKYAGRQVLWLTCPEDRSASMLTVAVTYLGVPYSYADYFAIAAHRLGLYMGRYLDEWVLKSHHVICSQLAAACADKAGWSLVDSYRAEYVTPARLASCAPPDAKPVLIQ